MGKDATTILAARTLTAVCMLLPVAALGQQTGASQTGNGWWAESKTEVVAEGSDDMRNKPAEPVIIASTPSAVALIPGPAASNKLAGPVSLSDFDCVEVQRFDVFSDFITSKQDARAATIPAEKLGALQREVAGQVPERIRGLKSTLVVEGAPQCPDPQRTLVLGGRITDFKAGNQALRYLVGFGAGAQKFSVLVRATRKSDGALVGEGEVTDRKIGGWIGGQDDKGMEDFAEKVADFLKGTLQVK